MFISGTSYALLPVESLIFGNFANEYNEKIQDPLSYIFSRDQTLKNNTTQFKKELAIYRGFYEEGKNLENYCKQKRSIEYDNEWKKLQVKRAYFSLIQYIGLDIATRAISQYAKKLDYNDEDFENLVNGLVGNYCSNNLTVISKRELTNNFFLKFKKENSFNLPSVAKNPFFPSDLSKNLTSKKSLEHEFLYSVKLFQNLCSWGGNPENPVLLVSLLKNSTLVAFFNRQMASLSIDWKESDNSLFLKNDPSTEKVWCENLICRKINREDLLNKFYFSIGGTSVSEDLKRLYCNDFKNSDYKPKENDPRLAKIMNSLTFDEENLINAQFVALLTGIPDFILSGEKFSNAMDSIRANVDDVWTQWAQKASENYTNELYFEEPLTIELIDREHYYNFRSKKLKVVFDINLGEFDRTIQQKGKIKVQFKLKIKNNFLNYYREALKNLNYADVDEKKRLKNRFKIQIMDEVKNAREFFLIPPWKGDLESLIVNELTAEILETPEKYLVFPNVGFQEIEIEMNYGIFALKYIEHQFKTKK